MYHQEIQRPMTRAEMNENVYGVKSDTEAQSKIQNAMKQFNLVPKNKGGRPRKVGRPKNK